MIKELLFTVVCMLVFCLCLVSEKRDCGVVWCGVVWCGVVWCGVVWCGVVWCGGIHSLGRVTNRLPREYHLLYTSSSEPLVVDKGGTLLDSLLVSCASIYH